MRMLLINVVCGIRSTGRICTDLAKALEAQGHTVKIAYGRESVPEFAQKYAVRIGTDADVRLHALKARLNDGCGFGSRRATERFLKWVRAYDPDVIHLHNLHGYYIHVGLLFDYLRSCGKKIIWTLHDCWPFTGHSAYCEGAGCERFTDGCHDCPALREYPAALTDRSKRNWLRKKEIFQNVPDMTLITPSVWLKGLAERSFLSGYPVKVIPNGIDTERFHPSANDTKPFFGIQNALVVCDYDRLPKGSVQAANRLAAELKENGTLLMLGAGEIPDGLDARAVQTASPKERDMLLAAADAIWDPAAPDPDAQICRILEQIRAARNEQTEASAKDTAGFWNDRAAYGLCGKRIVLGVASLWNERKGVGDMIALARSLQGKVRTVVVGVSDAQIPAFPAGSLCVKETDDVETLRRLYAMADAYVNPTYEDNYPTTNLEAVACGTVVLTYRAGGSPESAMGSGPVFDVGDVDGMRRYLETFTDAKTHADPSATDGKRAVEAYRKEYGG